MNNTIDMGQAQTLVQSHKERLKALLGIDLPGRSVADGNKLLIVDIQQDARGDDFPSGSYYRNGAENHIIVLYVHNIRDREPAGFKGTFEEKLLFVLAHEMIHVKQYLDGEEDKAREGKFRPDNYQVYLENQEKYREQWDETAANAFATRYVKEVFGLDK